MFVLGRSLTLVSRWPLTLGFGRTPRSEDDDYPWSELGHKLDMRKVTSFAQWMATNLGLRVDKADALLVDGH